MEQSSDGLRITVLGAGSSIILSAIKISGGLWWHSQALVADGIHSISDLATDIMVFLGLFYGSRPYDANHPYGHKKIETFSEIAVGTFLLGIACFMVYSAVRTVAGGKVVQPSLMALAVAAISAIIKEWLYRLTIKTGRRLESGALIANAWHHRSDALTSLATFAALALAQIHPALRVMDPVACIGISLVVGKIGGEVFYKAFTGIIDTAPEPEVIEQIRTVTMSNPKVGGMHKLRARYLGGQIIADLHILIDPSLSVLDGHDIATEVEQSIVNELGNIYDITVHVEPMLPESREN
ncbi:MAG: cation diffusion facilitator family transporter [Gemmatimonadota bacterium]|nr:cation diffusion facilitator family transporter [Gemmatimonadota bacterium]